MQINLFKSDNKCQSFKDCLIILVFSWADQSWLNIRLLSTLISRKCNKSVGNAVVDVPEPKAKAENHYVSEAGATVPSHDCLTVVMEKIWRVNCDMLASPGLQATANPSLRHCSKMPSTQRAHLCTIQKHFLAIKKYSNKTSNKCNYCVLNTSGWSATCRLHSGAVTKRKLLSRMTPEAVGEKCAQSISCATSDDLSGKDLQSQYKRLFGFRRSIHWFAGQRFLLVAVGAVKRDLLWAAAE